MSSDWKCLLLVISLSVLASTSYVSHSALEMGWLSEVAYESQKSIDAWSCPACKNIRITNQKSFFSSVANIQGFAGYLPDFSAILLSFRGSVDTKNWIANLGSAMSTYPGCSGCHVHTGFYVAYKGVSSSVRQAIANLQAQHRGAPIVITGHSLGGAMAILSALDLHQVGASVKFVYTFGQPRVGDSAFSKNYASHFPETYRVINYADIVPHLPPSSFGFVHGGHEVWYNPRGMQKYQICNAESSACANSLNVLTYNTDDHSLSNYLKMKVNFEEIAINEDYSENRFMDSPEAIEELNKIREQLSRLKDEKGSENRSFPHKFLRSK